MPDWLGYVLSLVFVLIGLAGLVLPATPGVPMVFAGLLLAAWTGGFTQVGGFVIVLLALMTLLAVVVDLAASAFGVRIAGASRSAFFGAALGSLVGLFFGLPGIVLGPFIGALLCEWAVSRRFRRAAVAGGGAALGLAVGAVLKIAITFGMLGVFALAWIW